MSPIKAFLFFSFALIYLNCVQHAASVHPGARIVGGKPATRSQFPWQVSLRIVFPDGGSSLNDSEDGSSESSSESSSEEEFDYEDFCSGTIIGNQWIITAAHCFDIFTSNVTNLVVIAGIINLRDETGYTYNIESIHIHPDYNEHIVANDIALVRTVETMNFSKYVAPVPLDPNYINGGLRSVTSGWGLTGAPAYFNIFQGNRNSTNILQYISVFTTTQKECIERAGDLADIIHDSILCTDNKAGQGTCIGDAGGPLVLKGKLVGVVSWGVLCASGKPDAFSRISSFIDWIQETSQIEVDH